MPFDRWNDVREERTEAMTPNDALMVTDDGHDVAVALGAAPAGRLTFANGSAQLVVRAVPDLDQMLRARFTGNPPRASLDAEAIVFRYPRLNRPFEWRGRRAEVSLSTTVPWEIEVRGGAANVEAELNGIELLGLRIGSGASGVEITLPPPIGAVPVTIGGGASNVRYPPSRGGSGPAPGARGSFTPRVRRAVVRGDRRPVAAAERRFREVADRYEISIGGGASHLTVSTV